MTSPPQPHRPLTIELPGDAQARTEMKNTSNEAALLTVEEGGAGPSSPADWPERQPTSSQRCMVCGDNEVPRHVAVVLDDGREYVICNDASWCQGRAAANAYECLVTSSAP